MIIAASVVAAIERCRRVMTWHRVALVAALVATATLGATAAVAVRDELSGDPWPDTVVAVVVGLLATSLLAAALAASVSALMRAALDATHVNRDAIERVRETMRSARAEVRERAGQMVAWLERIDVDIARVDRDHRREVAGLIEVVRDFAGQVERIGDQVERAHARGLAQGRAEAERDARIREERMRDAWIEEAARIHAEERAAARREFAGLLEAIRSGLREELSAVISQVESRARTDGFAEGYVSGIARRTEDNQDQE